MKYVASFQQSAQYVPSDQIQEWFSPVQRTIIGGRIRNLSLIQSLVLSIRITSRDVQQVIIPPFSEWITAGRPADRIIFAGAPPMTVFDYFFTACQVEVEDMPYVMSNLKSYIRPIKWSEIPEYIGTTIQPFEAGSSPAVFNLPRPMTSETTIVDAYIGQAATSSNLEVRMTTENMTQTPVVAYDSLLRDQGFVARPPGPEFYSEPDDIAYYQLYYTPGSNTSSVVKYYCAPMFDWPSQWLPVSTKTNKPKQPKT